MAVQTINPYPVASDMMQVDEIREQLSDTGYPVTVDLIKRWIRDQGLYTEKYRGRTYVSYSDILMAHKDLAVPEP
ncbi:hypothetical protein [Streptomyces microflavus]|uniref:hypothetical protein n=1 Tax=Streptomyces microflavus TaxID=1919 RepID=UPI003B21577D